VEPRPQDGGAAGEGASRLDEVNREAPGPQATARPRTPALAEAGPPLTDSTDFTDSRDRVRRQFGAHAERYVHSPDHARGESLDRLVALVDPQPHWRALDVATGGGHTALALSRRVRAVVATDLTPGMLAAAEAFLRGAGATNVAYQEADAEALPFEDASFDLVTCRVAPHHFPDCPRFVREAARVLRPGGVVCVVDNVTPDEPEAARFINELEALRDPSHHWAYTASEWVGFFEAAGLIVEATERFRKARAFERWAEVAEGESVRRRLEAMLRGASGAARDALSPEDREGTLYFYLTEILTLGRRRTA
jgi:ubiquinone/menaquinone biosynthesis C-methylase UbiE